MAHAKDRAADGGFAAAGQGRGRLPPISSAACARRASTARSSPTASPPTRRRGGRASCGARRRSRGVIRRFLRDGLTLRLRRRGAAARRDLPARPRRRRGAGRRGLSATPRRRAGSRSNAAGRAARPPAAASALSHRHLRRRLSALAEDARPGPRVVGGISMGAAIALRLAVRQPGAGPRPGARPPGLGHRRRPRQHAALREVGELLGTPSRRRGSHAASRPARPPRILAREAPDNLASLLGLLRPARARRLRPAAGRHRRRRPRRVDRRNPPLASSDPGYRPRRDLAHPLANAKATGKPHPRREACRSDPQGSRSPGVRSELSICPVGLLRKPIVTGLGTLIVVEIGGTAVKIGFAVAGQPDAFIRTFPTARIREVDPAAALVRLVREASHAAGLEPEQAIVTVPGFIDTDFDRVLFAANVPELNGRRLATEPRRALGMAVQLERDVVLQLLGECRRGIAAGETHVLASTSAPALALRTSPTARCSAAAAGHSNSVTSRRLRPPPGRSCVERRAPGRRPRRGALSRRRAFADPAGSPPPSTTSSGARRSPSPPPPSSSRPRVILIGGGVPEMPGFPGDTLARRVPAALPAPYRGSPPEIRWARLGWRARSAAPSRSRRALPHRPRLRLGICARRPSRRRERGGARHAVHPYAHGILDRRPSRPHAAAAGLRPAGSRRLPRRRRGGPRPARARPRGRRYRRRLHRLLAHCRRWPTARPSRASTPTARTPTSSSGSTPRRSPAAEAINARGGAFLAHFGGKLSGEWLLPKAAQLAARGPRPLGQYRPLHRGRRLARLAALRPRGPQPRLRRLQGPAPPRHRLGRPRSRARLADLGTPPASSRPRRRPAARRRRAGRRSRSSTRTRPPPGCLAPSARHLRRLPRPEPPRDPAGGP